jgi:hypothetical protein
VAGSKDKKAPLLPVGQPDFASSPNERTVVRAGV